MPLFRHHALLLAHDVLTQELLLGPTYRIRPSDGDGLLDRDQHWYALFDLMREGDGLASAYLSTSFDGDAWHPVATVTTKRSAQVVDLVELPVLGPLVRVHSLLESQGELPHHRLVVRLASDGPFTVVPG